ncbi:hypothetical protein ARMSODRAFT_684496 [Armillaria solidipes]|uniref:Uncharacterized protein n=1 Tax=Armillaria solidipes TaxID=1076256 RepID=A0A2H3BCQ6_9AGAR|nr:hypothetical protein ARMSODRAFT_684496 [Armillaria solidipes]
MNERCTLPIQGACPEARPSKSESHGGDELGSISISGSMSPSTSTSASGGGDCRGTSPFSSSSPLSITLGAGEIILGAATFLSRARGLRLPVCSSDYFPYAAAWSASTSSALKLLVRHLFCSGLSGDIALFLLLLGGLSSAILRATSTSESSGVGGFLLDSTDLPTCWACGVSKC